MIVKQLLLFYILSGLQSSVDFGGFDFRTKSVSIGGGSAEEVLF